MRGRAVVWAASIVVCVSGGPFALAGAFEFEEPASWAVGDPGSTYNNWEAASDETVSPPARPFSPTNMAPTSSTVSPTLGMTAGMNVQAPGFAAGSGGYYSFSGNYGIFVDIYNHGGSAAMTTDYLSGYGTRVIVQTAATTNTEFDTSVFQDSIELVKLDGTPLTGGANADLIGVTELFRQEVATPFGPADQQELFFEFYLPAYSGDFRVRFQAAVHSSFQELRIDTLLVEELSLPGDFDGDGDVDADDLADWQSGYGTSKNGLDFLTWQRNYTGPGSLAAVVAVPEPTSLMVVIFGIITGLTRRPPYC